MFTWTPELNDLATYASDMDFLSNLGKNGLFVDCAWASEWRYGRTASNRGRKRRNCWNETETFMMAGISMACCAVDTQPDNAARSNDEYD
jgi:hypothetical protein